MSGTVSRRRREAEQSKAEPQAAANEREPHGPGRWIALGIVVVVAAGAASAWRAGVFSPSTSSRTGSQGSPPPATRPVVRENLSSITPVTATLGYAGTYAVTGQGGGKLTWLPSPGQVITQGQALYKTGNGIPVALLYGSVPDWRKMSEGTTGQDVTQLNHDLVNLGDASRADIVELGWDYYSWETSHGVQQLEEHLGVSDPSGDLSLGEVVFKPRALRVSQVSGSLGGSASGSVLSATSDQHVVTIALSTSQESQVAKGDAVTVTLPNGSTTPGKITTVGTVASGTATNATIPVTVTLTHPSASGTLDQAPVTVNITTASVKDALAVPVSALVAESGGGYEVEVVEPGNTRRWVRVTPGIFDDANGMVQVAGDLTLGQNVVVAAS
jgi:multidrug efflux pump subunit AcrA (membrane-fusion protein)